MNDSTEKQKKQDNEKNGQGSGKKHPYCRPKKKKTEELGSVLISKESATKTEPAPAAAKPEPAAKPVSPDKPKPAPQASGKTPAKENVSSAGKQASKPNPKQTPQPSEQPKKSAPKTEAAAPKKPKRSGANRDGNAAGTLQVKAPNLVEEGVKPHLRNKDKGQKLRVMSLGGLEEIGKNMTVIEYGNDIIAVDCGMAFPDEEMPGVDLVIPDVTYLTKNADRVRGIFITHGHEDHIGALPYVLAQLHVPVYGTRLSLGIVEGKLEENPLDYEPKLFTVEAGDTVSAGIFSVEFIHVNHSIADACALAVRTPLGIVFHSGDFKLDVSPIDGKMMDLCRIAQIGAEGVTLLLCESTNAERHGFTPSEKTVGSSLERIFMQYEDRRLIISTFSSNVHRVQQIIDASARHGRKVAIMGRSMTNVLGAAKKLGYMDFPEDLLIDVTEMKKYKPEQITLITTGSQGEPMSALYRIAFNESDKVKLEPTDVVVISASAIPGNEKLVNKIINALIKQGVKVVNDAVELVHVSGHACSEEIKLLMSLTKPKFFMPIHGEPRHLHANEEIAKFMGIPAPNIFVSEIGKVLEITAAGAKWGTSVPSGNVLVDGSGIGDIGSIVLRDRKHLSEDGLVVVVAGVDMREGLLISGPDIVSRGFVYVKESEQLVDAAKKVAAMSLEQSLSRGGNDYASLKAAIRDDLAKFIFQKTKRKPMILPVIMDV